MSSQGDLWSAVKSGDVNAARKAISEGADINAVNPRGDYPLRTAVIGDNWPMFELLIATGADVNLMPRGYLTLMATLKEHAATLKNHDRFKAALVAAGAKTFPTGLRQRWAWNFVNRNMLGALNVCRSLGADLDEIYYETGDLGDLSLISLAIVNGNIPAMEWLMDRGASVQLKDRNGQNIVLNTLRYIDREPFFAAAVQLLEKKRPELFNFPHPQYDIDLILAKDDIASGVLWSFRSAIEEPWTTPRPLELQILCVQKASSGIASAGLIHWLESSTPETVEATIAGLKLIKAPQSGHLLSQFLEKVFPETKITKQTDYKTYRAAISALSADTPCVIEFEKGSFGHETNGYILDLAVEHIRQNLAYFQMAKPKPPPLLAQ